MEEINCIPGYENSNIQALYRPQEDYAYVNEIKAKKFVYNPNFKREPEGPYIREYYEHYEADIPLKNSLFSPINVSPQKLNRQCNPFVAYPYGVPQDPMYEKCSKCKGNKKYIKKKKSKKTKYYYENDYFTSKLKEDNCSPNLDSNKGVYIDDNENIQHFNYLQENNNEDINFHANERPFSNNFEDTHSKKYETKEKLSNSIEILDIDYCNKINNSFTNHPIYKDDTTCQYYYSYNEKANLNSQGEIKDYIEKYLSKNDLHLNDDDYEQNLSNEKSENHFKINNINAEEYQSTHGEEKENEIEIILSRYTDMSHENEADKTIDDEAEACEQNKTELLTVEKKRALPSKKIKVGIQERSIKQSKKQVKICENENILTKYNVMEGVKNNEVSKENIKVKSHTQKNNYHSLQESSKKKNEHSHNGRFCRLMNSKYEMTKKFNESKNKKEHTNSLELSMSNDEGLFFPPSPKKSFVKYRKISLDKNNIVLRKKNEKEINRKNSKAILTRARSTLKVRSTLNLSTKNSILPLGKKNNLNKLNSMNETRFKKQNTMTLKKKKSMSRVNSIKFPNRFILSKKKAENTDKSINLLDDKKKKEFQLRSKKLLSRSQTKVYINNESKPFKKAEVKMLSKNAFNTLVSKKSLKINELDNDKKKKIKEIPKTKRKTNSYMNTITPKVNSNSIRNKLKSKKKELFENILSLTKNMKENPLKKEYNNQIQDKDLLSLTSNNSDDNRNSIVNEDNSKDTNLTLVHTTNKKKKTNRK